ncbi:MAG: SRPBCC domain-containing protein [Brachybacterium sp.]
MVDVPTQLQSVTRSYRVEERDGAPAHVQSLEQTYPAALADVWDAVTTAERIQRWFLPISGDLQLGGRYQFEGNAGGEILACEPPADDGAAEYSVTWEMMGAVSWVTIRLAADGEDATRFELEHTSRTADIPAKMWETFGPGATGVGWDGGLLGLGLHLGATEGSLAPEEAEAWAFTEEERSFYRGAADGWAVAHTASGEDPAVAQQRADATYGFYTGTGQEA